MFEASSFPEFLAHLPYILALSFGYLVYLLIALRAYVTILKDLLFYAKSKNYLISFEFGWKGVKMAMTPSQEKGDNGDKGEGKR